MRSTLGLAVVLALCAAGAGADAPLKSLRPLPNPAFNAVAAVPSDAAPAADASTAAPPSALRPRPRPTGLTQMASAAAVAEPEDAAPAPKKKAEKASKKGSVCGDASIKGEALAPIKGKVKGCGLENPVRVTSISGIRLNQPATISCETATTMKQWITNALIPALGKREVVEIRIAASYICRPRNNKKGAKISEHGRGKALDVAGFVFSDGTEWSVLRDYNKQIRRAHKDACGIFGTTLGPGSDGYHEDHLHFDIASYRSGSYCR